ncbi:MAG: TIR domain-containing protein [Pseudomonadota bacterium]
MPDIFLSYSRDDQATARIFADAFEREGLSVWWDQTLRSGEAYDKVTEKSLEDAKAVVVLWSSASVDSRWVRAEATQADRSQKLVPVMIEPCRRPIMFELTHTADLSHWKGAPDDRSWQTFLSDVRQFVKREPPLAALPSIPVRRSGIRWRAIAIATVVVTLALAGAWLWARHWNGGVQAKPGASIAAVVPHANTQVTLAVLPFSDMSPGKDQEYFSDGLAEEILNQLAQIKELRVTARTSSFSFKGKNEDIRVIGEQLGVANLLEGSVRKDGTHLRITAQLISSKDGAHLWSQTYDRELKDVFAVQEAIAKDVAQALSIKLDVGRMSRARGGTTDLEAYDRFLQARAMLHQFGSAEILRARALYREAVTVDPNFALAWHGLYTALSYGLVTAPGRATETRKEMDQAAASLKALAPDAWWSLAAEANQLMLNRQWGEAGAAAAATVARTSDVDALAMYATFLVCVGRAKDAVEILQQAQRADPLSLRISGLLQLYLDVAGQPEEAQAEFERSKTLLGDHGRPILAAFLRLWRRSDANPAAVKAALHAFGENSLERELSGISEKPDLALATIHKAYDQSGIDSWQPLTKISFYADHYGDEDLALAAMRRSFLDFNKVNFEGLWWPFHSTLRADPRFKEILRDLGLVDYFRTSGNWGDFCTPVAASDFECR